MAIFSKMKWSVIKVQLYTKSHQLLFLFIINEDLRNHHFSKMTKNKTSSYPGTTVYHIDKRQYYVSLNLCWHKYLRSRLIRTIKSGPNSNYYFIRDTWATKFSYGSGIGPGPVLTHFLVHIIMSITWSFFHPETLFSTSSNCDYSYLTIFWSVKLSTANIID